MKSNEGNEFVALPTYDFSAINKVPSIVVNRLFFQALKLMLEKMCKKLLGKFLAAILFAQLFVSTTLELSSTNSNRFSLFLPFRLVSLAFVAVLGIQFMVSHIFSYVFFSRANQQVLITIPSSVLNLFIEVVRSGIKLILITCLIRCFVIDQRS